VETGLFAGSRYGAGSLVSPNGERTSTLSINGMVLGGQLQLTIDYNGKAYEADTIEELAAGYKRHLEAIIEHCADRRETEKTPSDLSFKQLTIQELEEFEEEMEWLTILDSERV
ncbi:condensation domain-containing protein, partial [Cohnella faecalis]